MQRLPEEGVRWFESPKVDVGIQTLWSAKEQAWVDLIDGQCPVCTQPLIKETADEAHSIWCSTSFYRIEPLPYAEVELDDALLSEPASMSISGAVRHVCKLFGVKMRQAYNLLGSGKVPNVREEDLVYLPPDSVLEPIARRFRDSSGKDWGLYDSQLVSGNVRVAYESRSCYGVAQLLDTTNEAVRDLVARGIISGWAVGYTYACNIKGVETFLSRRSTASLKCLAVTER